MLEISRTMDVATTVEPKTQPEQQCMANDHLHGQTPIYVKSNGTTDIPGRTPIVQEGMSHTTPGLRSMSPLRQWTVTLRSEEPREPAVACTEARWTQSCHTPERIEGTKKEVERAVRRNNYPKLIIASPTVYSSPGSPLSRGYDLESLGNHVMPNLDVDSPISFSTASDAESRDFDYDTPLTSPCVSPIKVRPPIRKTPLLYVPEQLDGAGDEPDLVASPSLCRDEDETPEVSPTKPAKGYPFPEASKQNSAISRLSAQRHPSALLQHCERNASPRQRRLMAGALQTADRFIVDRAHTPTKEALLLQRPLTKPGDSQSSARRQDFDPFGPSPVQSARSTERYATIRRVQARERQPLRLGSTVPDVNTNRRAVSAGAVWSVGGTVVTEGVASITNGRGGRITSSTSAPHYTSDFLRKQSPSEDENQHGQRLAVAMDISQGARMLAHSITPSPLSSPGSPRRSSNGDFSPKNTYWKDCAWEKDDISTPSKRVHAKPKEIPVIPFRVLDAPALRDDYYCSLLAYSVTMRCLAVGLGPHVYLWSEARGTTPTHLPDSLTAPFASHVTSLSFSSTEGGSGILAIGRADGRITLWSPLDHDPRFDSEQPAPVSCVCFRPNTVKRPSIRDPSMTVATEELLVGDEAGHVYYYSIEWPCPDQKDLFGWHGSMTLLARMSCHTQQVCGIAWSREGEYFATGGNDNQLYLFETKKLFARARTENEDGPSVVKVRNGATSGDDSVAGQGRVLAFTQGQQRHLFTLNAAVKAISFAPWQASLIAAGGGSNDRCIHFFHALSGATLATIDCHAQITSLVWSEKRKEIAATFGFAQPEHPYRVAVFAWPSCRRIVGIPWWSEERALYAVAYPGGPSGSPAERRRNEQGGRPDAEGNAWYGRRTKEEGCLVIATSDASIKFHEIWPERSESGKGRKSGGVLGGSLILEDGVSEEIEREATIR